MTRILKSDSKGPPLYFFQMTQIFKIDSKGPPLYIFKFATDNLPLVLLVFGRKGGLSVGNATDTSPEYACRKWFFCEI